MERMHTASRITCLWPGLFRLWYQGDLSALAAAIAFAVLLNCGAARQFARSGTLPGSWIWGGWALVVAFWAMGVGRGLRQRSTSGDIARSQNQQDLFIRAQTEYLRGHWVEAQTLLEQLIRRHPGDVESRLLLSSVYRRTRRIDLADQELRRLQGIDGAAKWQFEIRRELATLEQASAAGG